jgi:hypothetical protein
LADPTGMLETVSLTARARSLRHPNPGPGRDVRPDLRPLARLAVVLCLAAQVLTQHLVLDHEVSGTVAFHDDYSRIVTDLRGLGVRPPCLIKGEQYIPVAFYAGCASAPGLANPGYAGRVALLEYPGTPRPRYARGWHRHRLPGTRVLQVVAYLPPRPDQVTAAARLAARCHICRIFW